MICPSCRTETDEFIECSDPRGLPLCENCALNTNGPIIAIELSLLERIHFLMDDANASIDMFTGCRWCHATGYDGDGLKHYDHCIIRRLRAELER